VTDLVFLDESGFAPTMPTGYTWARTGERAVVGREDKKDRRVNVLGALSLGPQADLVWEQTCGKIGADRVLEFVCTRLAGLPGGAAALADPPQGWQRAKACTVVLDNASAHVAKAVKGRREELARIGVELFYLPPRSPELNAIERIWRSAKYEDYPERSHTSIEALGNAVDQALQRQRARIKASAAHAVPAPRLEEGISAHRFIPEGPPVPGEPSQGLPAPPQPAKMTGPVTFAKVVPTCGNMRIRRKQFWLGAKYSGLVVTVRATTEAIQIQVGATTIRSVPSHLTDADLAALAQEASTTTPPTAEKPEGSAANFTKAA
jgi:DDE superfamily endonuclease